MQARSRVPSDIHDDDEELVWSDSSTDDDEADQGHEFHGLKNGAAPSGINVDKWVLKSENQTKPAVTPLIGALASHFFQYHKVVETALVNQIPFDAADGPIESTVYTNAAALNYLQELIDKHHGPRAKYFFPRSTPSASLGRRRPAYASAVNIDGETYTVSCLLNFL